MWLQRGFLIAVFWLALALAMWDASLRHPESME